MEGVIEHYREVIFNEPRHHRLIDLLCVMTIVFFGVYGSMFLYLSRHEGQGVVLPDAIYVPTQPTSPNSTNKQPTMYQGLPILQN